MPIMYAYSKHVINEDVFTANVLPAAPFTDGRFYGWTFLPCSKQTETETIRPEEKKKSVLPNQFTMILLF
jgi:hypothetical protein